MPTYRVVAGTFRRPDGSRATVGDTVSISESIAADFPHTFERVRDDASATEPDTDTASEDVEESVEENVEESVEEVKDGDNRHSDTDADTDTGTDEDDESKLVDAAKIGSDDETETDTDAETDTTDDGESEPESPDGMTDKDVGSEADLSHIPDDYAMLAKMAKHYDGDEIHGSKSGHQIRQHLSTLPRTQVAALKRQAKQEISN
jgi:hypothetical protein